MEKSMRDRERRPDRPGPIGSAGKRWSVGEMQLEGSVTGTQDRALSRDGSGGSERRRERPRARLTQGGPARGAGLAPVHASRRHPRTIMVRVSLRATEERQPLQLVRHPITVGAVPGHGRAGVRLGARGRIVKRAADDPHRLPLRADDERASEEEMGELSGVGAPLTHSNLESRGFRTGTAALGFAVTLARSMGRVNTGAGPEGSQARRTDRPRSLHGT